MPALVLPTLDEALGHGYGTLHDPADLYHSPRWLRAEEQVKIAPLFYALCESGGARPAALASTWGLVVDDTASWPFMRVDIVLSGLLDARGVAAGPGREQTLNSLLPNAYLGALRGGTTGLRVSPGLDGAHARRAIDEILAGVEPMARARGLRSIAFLYAAAEDRRLRQALRDHGYVEIGPAHSIATLRVTGQTFGDYLRRFGKRRRDSIRWERRKIAAAGVQIQVEDLNAELSREMMPLEAQLFRKYGHAAHPDEIARLLHDCVAREFGRCAKVITARGDGALRGYAHFIEVGDMLYSRDTGFDYTWNDRSLPLYFEVLFYRAMEFALESGKREIYYAQGSEQTKVSRGCDLHPRFSYVKALDPRVSAELRRLCAAVPAPRQERAGVAGGGPS